MIQEEHDKTTPLSSDDLDALRVLLHSVKGISMVSSISSCLSAESEE